MKTDTLSTSHKSRLKTLYKLFYDKELPSALTHDNMDFLSKSKEKIISVIYINYNKLNTILSYLSTIKFVTKQLNMKEAYDYYTILFDKLKLEQTELLDKNVMTNAQKSKYIPWSKVLDIDINHLSQSQQLLYKLYTDVPPRRIMDYQLLKYTIKSNPSIDFNWIVFKNSLPNKIIINKFKTVKTYGSYVFDIPTKLAKQWCLYTNYRDDHYVFPNRINTSLSQGQFSKLVVKVFGLTLNDLRHISITDFMNKKRSIDDIKKRAFAMGTSKEELERYNKVDL